LWENREKGEKGAAVGESEKWAGQWESRRRVVAEESASLTYKMATWARFTWHRYEKQLQVASQKKGNEANLQLRKGKEN